jgi:glycosyltransferase involved in cell wall biosynthesis
MPFFYRFAFFFQRVTVYIVYGLCCATRLPRVNYEWVIGTVEGANGIALLGKCLPNAFTVCLSRHPFFSESTYTLSLSARYSIVTRFIRFFLGPILLGILARSSARFLYYGGSGFLLHEVDGRKWEFSFLRQTSRNEVGVVFVGSEIRSILLARRFNEDRDLESIATYHPQTINGFRQGIGTPSHERQILAYCRAVDDSNVLAFNANVDQISYLKSRPSPFRLPVDLREPKLISGQDRTRILHAPSDPFIKGTQVVRAAIKYLKTSGYSIDYVELSGAKHSEVISAIEEVDIVINELYALVPGMLGLETMACCRCLVTSADGNLEDFPDGWETAWIKAGYWELVPILEKLLKNPALVNSTANCGYEWVTRNYSYDRVKSFYVDAFNRHYRSLA